MTRFGLSCSLLTLVIWAAPVMAQDAEPARRVANVEWPAAGFTDPPPRHSKKAAKTIRTVQLPVLIPISFARYKSFQVVSAGPYDYSASVLSHGAKLWINGSRQQVIPPPGALTAATYEPDPGAFDEPDPPEPRIVNRRFNRYGVGYVISAECARPEDTRCDEAFLVKLEKSLRVFGGAK